MCYKVHCICIILLCGAVRLNKDYEGYDVYRRPETHCKYKYFLDFKQYCHYNLRSPLSACL